MRKQLFMRFDAVPTGERSINWYLTNADPRITASKAIPPRIGQFRGRPSLHRPDAHSTSSLRVTKKPLRSGSCSIILRA